MKKVIIKIVMGIFMCIAALHINSKTETEVKAEVKPEYMQDVPLDGVYFPDEQFREELKRLVDQNKDGILSREEREEIHYLRLNCVTGGVMNNVWYTDMKYISEHVQNQEDQIIYTKGKHSLELGFKRNNGEGYKRQDDVSGTLNVRGIEYFFNLQEVMIDKYELVSGSFKNNANLKKIWIGCSKTGQRGYGNIKGDFPVSQLTYMHLENIDADALNVKDIPELQVLRVILPKGSNRRLPALNLSENTKLKELELANIMPGKLDLRQNRKIESVKVYSGKYGSGRGNSIYYLPEKEQKCKITFAKKNEVRTFWYFTADKKIDITRLSKLEDFQTLKTTKAKVKSSWIRKTFTKKKWGCAVIKSGKIITKIKADKKKKYTIL